MHVVEQFIRSDRLEMTLALFEQDDSSAARHGESMFYVRCLRASIG